MSLFGVLAAMARSSKICIILPGLKATSCLTVVLLVCLETVLLSTVSNCAKTFYVHWNTTNSIFRIDNTDHIIDVNKGNLQFEYDQVNIICPVYSPGSFDEDAEKYIIYNVSKEEYDTCRITNPNPRIIAICDKPHKLMYFTITFRPFTPQPGGLEFLPGNDYYFISTSSKDDLHRRIGGRCSTHNMKVVFKVCCPVEEPISTSAIPQIKIIIPHSTPSGMIGHYRPSTSAVSWPTWSSSQSVARGTVAPPSTDKIVPAHKPPLKKTTDEFDKHPNEVVKNEELTYSGTATSINYATWINVVAAMVIIRWR